MTEEPILGFKGENRFLSNFQTCQLTWDGCQFPSVEHAYVYEKIGKPEDCLEGLLRMTAGAVKRFGRRMPMAVGWDERKLRVMTALVYRKFAENLGLAEKLLATGNRALVELNTWGDTYWGAVESPLGLVGHNNLGRVLEDTRRMLRASYS